MALANFFNKAALAASHVLQGFDRAAFAGVLQSHVIGIALDNDSARSPEGAIALSLTVNLLARLYPRLAIVPLDAASEATAERLAGAARVINPDIDIAGHLSGVAACVAVCTSEVRVDAPTIYIGSEGWTARLSPSSPVGSGGTDNPFGAGAAACFGAANVFRLVFREQLQQGAADDPFSLSVFDYTRDANSTGPQIAGVDLGESYLVGLGAIGNGAIWALAKLPQVHGTLHVIDDESVELSNLQRYVLTGQADVGVRKVELAKSTLATSGIDVQSHGQRWGRYLRERDNWDLQRVAVAVDSVRDRLAIQGSLPRWIVNAWTQAGDLGVSRHAFVGDHACLACLYFPSGPRKNEDEIIAEDMKIPDAIMEIRALLFNNGTVGRPLLERVATAWNTPVEPLLAFEGKPIRTFYTDAICGGIVLNLGGGTVGAAQAEVPMVFQSALAGILLAGELVSHAAGWKQAPPPVTTTFDLLRPLGEHFSLPYRKHPSGQCICQDEDYINVFRAKYC